MTTHVWTLLGELGCILSPRVARRLSGGRGWTRLGPLQLGSMLSDATRLHIRAYLALITGKPNNAH